MLMIYTYEKNEGGVRKFILIFLNLKAFCNNRKQNFYFDREKSLPFQLFPEKLTFPSEDHKQQSALLYLVMLLNSDLLSTVYVIIFLRFSAKVIWLNYVKQGVKLRLIQAPMRLNFSLWRPNPEN